MRLIGSLAVHAVIGALLFAVTREAPPVPAGAPVSIEIVEVPPAPAVAVVPASREAGVPGGGGGGARGAQPAVAPAPVRAAARRVMRAQHVEARRDDDAVTLDELRGGISMDRGGSDAAGAGSGTGTGTGTGKGGGRGNGIGFGDGGQVAPPTVVTPPPAPRISKARPARLIFPTREREVDDGQLYIMRVTVDADGFVAGASMTRGFGGHRDDVASTQIWRFRYDPARDDDGQPVASVLEQRFLVQ